MSDKKDIDLVSIRTRGVGNQDVEDLVTEIIRLRGVNARNKGKFEEMRAELGRTLNALTSAREELKKKGQTGFEDIIKAFSGFGK